MKNDVVVFDSCFFQLGDSASDQSVDYRFIPSCVNDGDPEGRAIKFFCELGEVLDSIAHRRVDDGI